MGMPLNDLAKAIGVDPANLRKKIIREKIETTVEERMTRGGIQKVTVVPASYANQQIRRYKKARSLATKSWGPS